MKPNAINTNTLFNSSINSISNHKIKFNIIKSNENSIDIILEDLIPWHKHEEIWINVQELNKKTSDPKKYIISPNYNDILISSYFTLYPSRYSNEALFTHYTVYTGLFNTLCLSRRLTKYNLILMIMLVILSMRLLNGRKKLQCVIKLEFR